MSVMSEEFSLQPHILRKLITLTSDNEDAAESHRVELPLAEDETLGIKTA